MKHHFSILILVILCSQYTHAQELEKKTNLSPEITFSLNRTTAIDGNAHGKFGFGVGVHHALFHQKRCNLIVGFECNRNIYLLNI